MSQQRHRVIAVAALGLVAIGGAVAGSYPGWTDGTTAAGTPAVIAPDASDVQRLELPRDVARAIRKPTLLYYFSPDCSHCRDVAPEIAGMAAEFGRDTPILAVATARSTPEEVAAFVAEFAWDFEVVIDTEAEISAAMGVNRTPAALMVERRKGTIVVTDQWVPYRQGDDALIRMRVRGEPWTVLAEGGYFGDAVCAECHTEESRAWQLSHHSVAWRTLVLSKGSRDPECTDCHVTGAGEEGGWPGVGSRWMVDVGCESCHGAAGPHDGQPTEPSSTCEGCHDEKHSINFTYEKGLPLIDHYKANPLSDAAFDEARSALVGGEAPKELLAFDDGPYAGAEACASCHKDTHAWWAGSAHGSAMETLTAQGKHEDMSCVRCHATPQVSGPAPKELSGYRVEESVGCESCHGPGGTHVEAGGGKGNIVGLGGSCPVCVIEAICTSCHTPKWDPDWELETRLAGVAHDVPVQDTDTGAE